MNSRVRAFLHGDAMSSLRPQPLNASGQKSERTKRPENISACQPNDTGTLMTSACYRRQVSTDIEPTVCEGTSTLEEFARGSSRARTDPDSNKVSLGNQRGRYLVLAPAGTKAFWARGYADLT